MTWRRVKLFLFVCIACLLSFVFATSYLSPFSSTNVEVAITVLGLVGGCAAILGVIIPIGVSQILREISPEKLQNNAYLGVKLLGRFRIKDF